MQDGVTFGMSLHSLANSPSHSHLGSRLFGHLHMIFNMIFDFIRDAEFMYFKSGFVYLQSPFLDKP